MHKNMQYYITHILIHTILHNSFNLHNSYNFRNSYNLSNLQNSYSKVNF